MIDTSHISLMGLVGAVLVLARLWATVIRPIIKHREETDTKFELLREFVQGTLSKEDQERFGRLWKELING